MAIPSGMRKFVAGLVIGAAVAFHLGINFGRDRPLLSNPYEKDVATASRCIFLRITSWKSWQSAGRVHP